MCDFIVPVTDWALRILYPLLVLAALRFLPSQQDFSFSEVFGILNTEFLKYCLSGRQQEHLPFEWLWFHQSFHFFSSVLESDSNSFDSNGLHNHLGTLLILTLMLAFMALYSKSLLEVPFIDILLISGTIKCC